MRIRGKWAGGVLLLILIACLAWGAAWAEDAPEDDARDYYDYAAGYTQMDAGEALRIYDAPEGHALREGESLSFTFSVPADAFAYPVFTYTLSGQSALENAYTLALDGQMPFKECGALTLPSRWDMPKTYPLDRYGNEVAGVSRRYDGMLTDGLMSKTGRFSRGMGLMLTAGEHTLTITCQEIPFTLYAMDLAALPAIGPSLEGEIGGGDVITIQAEAAPRRNNSNIRVAASYDADVTPCGREHRVMNYVEDGSYNSAGDRLTYAFRVDQAGYYALALRMRQAELANFPIYRTFLLDGQIPSVDFDTARFEYAPRFGNQTVFAADGEPALIYLSEGEHELTLLTTIDPLVPALRKMERISNEIAAMALDITKVTGGSTDFYRDFNLADFEFNVEEELLRWADEIEQVRAELAALADTEGTIGALSNLDIAAGSLRQLARRPNDLPKKMSMFSSGSASARGLLVSQISSLCASAMGLDSIHFYTDAAQLPQGMAALDSAAFAAQRFAASFSPQAYAAGNTENQEALQVWVNRAQPYLEIMQQMTDAQFTAQTGIQVDFSIMPDESKLVLANASGNAPDAALGVSSARVYDLAVRGTLLNLRQFDDFKATAAHFPVGLLIPGMCDEGMYALPETFTFTVLYYRKDILDNLGLQVPNSYEDVLAMLPALHRYGLNYNNYLANYIGNRPLTATAPFIFQKGGKLYEPGNIKISLNQKEAIDGLQMLTDSFLIYDMDYQVDSFYQSFIDGNIPIGTSDLFMYTLLTNAAPELADRWGIALYPGLTDENGQVQRWMSGAAQSAMIFEDTQKPLEAWAFLQWWMSAETQAAFANRLQSTLGSEYLWPSANKEAFANSPWPKEHRDVILEQMEWILEPPRILGAYMVEREIANAVNSVILNGENLRAALDEAIRRIDREVERKLEEFGYLKDGKMLKPLVIPGIDTVKEWLQ